MKNVRVKRKEAFLAVLLSFSITLFTVYFNTQNNERASYNLESLSVSTTQTSHESVPEAQERFKLVSEIIEGELESGAFKDVIGKLEVLTEENNGYVKFLHMTYVDGGWSGQMICKLPPANVSSFTFSARAMIEENGTVTYISISVEDVDMSKENQGSVYSTVSLNLKEIKPEAGENEISASLASVLPLLTTSFVWIAEGLIFGVPLCFVSLGIVLLFSRGIIPLWKNTLKNKITMPKIKRKLR